MHIWLFRFKFWGNIWDKYSHLPLCLCISILLALTQVHCGVISGKTKISAEQKYLTKQDFSKCRLFFFFLFYLRAQQGSMVSSSAKWKMNIFYDVPQELKCSNTQTTSPIIQYSKSRFSTNAQPESLVWNLLVLNMLEYELILQWKVTYGLYVQ